MGTCGAWMVELRDWEHRAEIPRVPEQPLQARSFTPPACICSALGSTSWKAARMACR